LPGAVQLSEHGVDPAHTAVFAARRTSGALLSSRVATVGQSHAEFSDAVPEAPGTSNRSGACADLARHLSAQ
jgi:hypothetical protein